MLATEIVRLATHNFTIEQHQKRSMTIVKCQKTRRPVHFDAKSCMATTVHQLPRKLFGEKNEDIWYDNTEMSSIRNSARIRAVLSRQHGSDSFLTGTMKQLSSKMQLLKEHDAQMKLIHWTTSGHSSRGLEVLVNQQHGQLRSHQRRFAIQQVLLAQAKYRKAFIKLKPTLTEDYLAYVAKYCSKHAVCFASMMGTADALAAYQETIC